MAKHTGAHACAPQHIRLATSRRRAESVLAFTCAGLLGLTLLSMHAVCGTYAKYVTSGTGSDVARVARFGTVTVTGGDTVNITGSSAMGKVTEARVGDSGTNGIAMFAAADASEPVKVQMTRTEVAAKVLLTIQGSGWRYGTNADKQGILYYGLAADDATVWFEVGEGWEYLPDSSKLGEYVFSRIVKAGDELDASVMKYDRLYSKLTVESRAALTGTTSTPSGLTFSAQAIQVD